MSLRLAVPFRARQAVAVRPLTRRLAAAALSILVLLAGALHTQPVQACGGCVAPPLPPESPLLVKQAGERILFVRNDKTDTTTVHIEIRYTGLAKDFGWVLPLPKVPKVAVGSDLVFKTLDQRTAPRFSVQWDPYRENCRDPQLGCDSSAPGPDVMSADTSSSIQDLWNGGGGDGGGTPSVVVLASGETGPFVYDVLAAKVADPLLKWLEDNGYSLPAKAAGIVQSHLDKGDVFVAVKLQNGQGIEAIRPIVLEMAGTEACVPLRLTSIAAVDDMDVQVFLIGSGRAVPKNMLHVEPNPLWFQWSSVQFSNGITPPSNYLQSLSAAMDEADGAAFVTEFANTSGEFEALNNAKASFLSATSNVTGLESLATWINYALLLTSGPAVVAAVEDATNLPEALSITAVQLVQYLPYCYQPFWSRFGNSPQACLNQSLGLSAAKLEAATVDSAALSNYVATQWWAPLDSVQEVLDDEAAKAWLTRLHVRLDPEEMDRDPLFGFNPSLPTVVRRWEATAKRVCTDGWEPPDALRWSFAGLGTWVDVPVSGAENALAQRLGAPAALRIELLDEQGPPMVIAAAQAPQVAAAIAGSLPGGPQLPSGFVVLPGSQWQAPPSDKQFVQPGPWPQPYWCTPLPGWVDGQVPPLGQAGGVDGGTLDVRGVDAWQNVEDVQGTSPNVQASSGSNGCTATRPVGQAASTCGAIALLAVSLLLRRRRGSPARTSTPA